MPIVFKNILACNSATITIFQINNENELLFFYDNQFTIAGTRGVVSIKTPFKTMEHNLGIGLRAGLWENFSATFKMGGGIAHFWDIPENYSHCSYRTNSLKYANLKQKRFPLSLDCIP